MTPENPSPSSSTDSFEITGELSGSIAEIGKDTWDAFAGVDHPFVSYDFLHLLEETGCVSAATGWQPQHLTLKGSDGRVVGVMPLYLKGHSYGEYIFDHSWAAAFERAGGQYYPKLLSAVPFSPVTGPRLLVKPGQPDAIRAALPQLARRVADKQGLSSLHLNFIDEETAGFLEQEGFLIRHDQQFHFENQGYETFDCFLNQLASRKRKNLRKERAKAQEPVKIHQLQGDDIKAEHWDAFYGFYMDTGARKWGRPYLNRAFFEGLGDIMADKCLLVMAEGDEGDWLAGALNIIGSDTLYGRYWGCNRHIDFLHFEICYYQAIDYAIEHGLKRVEAGAQGQHKLARGYAPARTYSAHYLPDPGFRVAVERYLEMERREVGLEMSYLDGHTPFKQGD